MYRNLYEVFEEFVATPGRKKKVEVLRRNRSYALLNVLKGTFDNDIQFTIKTIPHYNVSDAPIGMGYNTIHQELGRSYIFEKGNPRTDPNLTDRRKEEILIQILEGLEKKEAEIFVGMLTKKLNVPGLTTKIVEEAFPGLIMKTPEEANAKEETEI